MIPIGLLALAEAFSTSTNFQWQFNSTFGFCAAQQFLGSPNQAIRIIRTPASEDTVIVLFDGSRWHGRSPKRFEAATLQVGSGARFSGRANGGDTGKKGSYISVLVSSSSLLGDLAASSVASVSAPGLEAISAAYRDGSSLPRLRQCEDEKMTSWGIDSKSWHDLRSPPHPLADFRSWIQPEAQKLMFSRDPNGQAVIEFTVEADGSVTHCRGIDPSIARDLNDAACDGIRRRAKFLPAVDANGTNVASPYVIVAEFEQSGG